MRAGTLRTDKLSWGNKSGYSKFSGYAQEAETGQPDRRVDFKMIDFAN